jgi:hypothetical protein
VVHSILEQLRTLLIVWLLLTVPVVCHHETAVTIVAALAVVRPHGAAALATAHTHAAAAALHLHGDHTAESTTTDAANDRLATLPPMSDTGRWWCSHHSSTGAGLLPEGLDSSALLTRPPVATLATSSVSAAGAQTVLPSSHTSPPPAPPPRPALV